MGKSETFSVTASNFWDPSKRNLTMMYLTFQYQKDISI